MEPYIEHFWPKNNTDSKMKPLWFFIESVAIFSSSSVQFVCINAICIGILQEVYSLISVIYTQYYLMLEVSTLVFGLGAQYLPEAKGRGQILGTKAK